MSCENSMCFAVTLYICIYGENENLHVLWHEFVVWTFVHVNI